MADDFLFVQLLNERKLLKDIDAIPDDIRLIIREKVKDWTYKLQDLVIQNIQQAFFRKEGKLEDSIDVEFVEEGLRIEGRVYSHGVAHAKIQEEGGTTPPHVIFPKNGKVLAFMAASGHKVFATHVYHPGGQILGQHYMKNAYREMSPKITAGLYYELIRKVRNRLERAGK